MTIAEDEDDYQIEWQKPRITALASPDRTFNSSSCLPSIVNGTPCYLNFTCFTDGPLTYKEHWTEFLKRCTISVFEVLILIPAMSHAAAKPFNACWTPDSEASKTKYLRKATDHDFFISLAELVHRAHENYENERRQNTPLPKNTNFRLTVE